MSDWYPFENAGVTADNALGLADWSPDRAGDNGRVQADGKTLTVSGEPIKLWGVNNEYADCAPAKEAADFRAAFYARQGFNAIRQHKYNDGPGWAGIQSKESIAEFNPAALDRFDYYNAQLLEHGIFINLSSNFGVKYFDADAGKVEAHEDFARQGKKKGDGRYSTGHGAVFLSPGLQQLHIEQLQSLLNHRNPYTGMTYAEDPGIAFVEIFNEDSILFYGTLGQLQKSPILRQMTAERFADWLEDKYGSEQAWRKAWGESVIVSDPDNITNNHLKNLISPDKVQGLLDEESFETGVVPWGQPWFYDQASVKKHEDPGLAALKQRMLDTMEFLAGLQDEFYARAVEGIRETGYPGEIIGSNWQAGSMAGHYWNLETDAKVGLIDRHNYYGGTGGLKLHKGKYVNLVSQLDRPGRGLLSTGMQQVSNRPFMISEWNVVQPSEWYLEGPTIIGAYGMGLQGWDASFIFASYQNAGYAPTLDAVKVFSIDTPPILGLMPAISRMVRRGDIQEATREAVFPAGVDARRAGEFSFEAATGQEHDLKSFDSDRIPMETLAVARVNVDLGSDEQAKDFPLDDFRAHEGIRSSTGELFWTEHEGEHDDYFIVNTAGTKGLVGFTDGTENIALGDLSIQPDEGFGAILLTAQSPEGNLATDPTALLVAIGRARNTGMDFSEDGTKLLQVGQGPVLLEPIYATLDLGQRRAREVRVLDHAGQPTGNTLPLRNNRVTIDTADDQTPYYQVVWAQ